MATEILWEIEPLLEQVTNLKTDVLAYEGISFATYDYPEGMPAMDRFRDCFEQIQRLMQSYFGVVDHDILNLADVIRQMRELDRSIMGTTGGLMVAENAGVKRN